MKKALTLSAPLFLLLSGCAHDEHVYDEHAAARTLPPPLPENRTPYNHPLASPGEQFGRLPPTVQNTVRAEVGAANISRILVYHPEGRAVYLIEFENDLLYPPLHVAADGSVLNPDLTVAMGAAREPGGLSTGGAATGLGVADLPPPVLNALPNLAPGAVITSISKEVWGDKSVYVLSFKDEAHHPRLFIASDGTVMKGGKKEESEQPW